MPEWQHQAEDIQENGLNPVHAFYWDPRTGKTRTACGHIARLHEERGVRKTLVLAPQLPLRTAWTGELRQVPKLVINDLAHGKIVDRIAALNKIILLSRAPQPQHQVVLVNYDVLGKLREALVRWNPTLVIADEAHLCKSPSAVRTMALIAIGNRAAYKRALTGTPDPQSYQDYYALYKFLDVRIFGPRLADFRERYLNMHPIYKSTVISHRADRLPELQQKVLSIASRKRRSECFDMPREMKITREVAFDEQGADVYDRVLREHEYASNWLNIDASEKIARLGILQRITSGFVYEPQAYGPSRVQWVHREKINAAVEEVSDLIDAGKKVVVFYLYRAEGDALYEAMQAAYGKVVARLSGQTKADDRVRLSAAFDPNRATGKEKTRILIVQEQVGALGISFALAEYAVFFSYSMNYATHSQALDRIWSPGSERTLTTTYLVIPKTVDATIRKIVSTKEALSRLLLDTSPDKLARGD